MKTQRSWEAWSRADGRKGLRNYLLIVNTVECAKHVAEEIASYFNEDEVQVIGFSGCYPNDYGQKMLQRLCAHPNTGATLIVSLGCESFDRNRLRYSILESGRPAEAIVIQENGGTRKSIDIGKEWVSKALHALAKAPRAIMLPEELIVGTICGGSDATSGITANPAIGRCFDRLLELGGTCVFEETGELIGCEEVISSRGVTPELGEELKRRIEKAARYYTKMGHGSFAPGNAEGGLTTQEEKSLGAYAKSGDASISGILTPGDQPAGKGLYLLDVVPDGDIRFGFPNINDNAEITELIACGCHLTLFSTGRGSVVGSAISPVIKICANAETYFRMKDDMDVNAGKILEGTDDIDSVGLEILNLLFAVASGEKTASERLGHREFVLGYKSFEPLGPGCFPK